VTNAYRRLVLIASNEEEEDVYQLRIDRINADIAAAACEVVALAIMKLTFEGPIILKDTCLRSVSELSVDLRLSFQDWLPALR
jgi:hypothetical protein